MEPSARLAERLLLYLQHPRDVHDREFMMLVNSAAHHHPEVFEQLRAQSNQFATLYPLLAAADEKTTHRHRFLVVLSHCAHSSVSASLLGSKKRLWGFLCRLFDDALIDDDLPHMSMYSGGIGRVCNPAHGQVIGALLPYVNDRAWKYAVRCGILQHLLTAMQKNAPGSCHSLDTLGLLDSVLSLKVTRGSIDALVNGGLFTLLEQLIQKSGNLLQGTKPCVDCHRPMNEN